MKQVVVAIFALAVLSVGFAGGWNFVERHDDARDKDTSYVLLRSENSEDGNVVVRCDGGDWLEMYVTTAELHISRTEQKEPDSATFWYAATTWQFDSEAAVTELLSVAVSKDAVFFSGDALGHFLAGLVDGAKLEVRAMGVAGNQLTYNFDVTGGTEALRNLSCISINF